MDWQDLMFPDETLPTPGKYTRILVDGSHLLHRSAHSYADLSFVSEGGDIVPTGAIYGFLRVMMSTWKRYADKGCQVTVCWEGGYKHRTDIYPDYKANRRVERTEEEVDRWEGVVSQRELLQGMMLEAGWAQAVSKGYEADDVLATLARDYASQGERVAIYTGDQDLHQCVTDTVHVVSAVPRSSVDKVWTPALVLDKWGVPPSRVAEAKALAGDMGDNIPGCPGCGLGWTKKFLASRSVLDVLEDARKGVLTGVYEGKTWTAKSLSKKINDNEKLVLVSWELAKVVEDCPVLITQQQQNKAILQQFLEGLRFHSLAEGKLYRTLLEIT